MKKQYLHILIALSLHSLMCSAMEKNDTTIIRDISVVEAFITPSFDIKEIENEPHMIFKAYDYYNNNPPLYEVPLKVAALILYQFRRDRADFAAFSKTLNQLTDKLFKNSYDTITLDEAKAIQAYRLLFFDVPQKELNCQRAKLICNFRKTNFCVSSYQDTLNEQYKQIILNRTAYNTAFCIADKELIEKHRNTLLRYKPIVPLRESIQWVQKQCAQHIKPFYLTEL